MAIEVVEKEKKCRKCQRERGAPEWMVTYGDVMTLLLTFFIMLLSPAVIEGEELRLILANFPGLGNMLGGKSFNEGRLPHSGQITEALPSRNSGNALDRLKSQAVDALREELNLDSVSIQLTERGLAISLSSDIFFEKYSANLNIDDNIETLRRIASLMRNFLSKKPNSNFRLEGHTDETNLPAGSPYIDEWGLSAARAVSVLRFLEEFLVPTQYAQVTGYGSTRLRFDTEDITGSTFNRRVDIVILNEGIL